MSDDKKDKAEQQLKELHKMFDFVSSAPPPDIKKRALIFDSLLKVSTHSDPQKSQEAGTGTFVFTWGAGYHGQLGRQFRRGHKKYSTTPLLVEIPEKCVIRQVSCGGLHTAVVTEQGRIYAWGDGRNGELGNGDNFITHTPVLIKSLTGHHIVSVQCGGSHSVALTNKGTLFGWGLGKHCQLGLGDRSNYKEPMEIKSFRNAKDERFSPMPRFKAVACGQAHTVAVTVKGQVFACGRDKHGQTGIGKSDDIAHMTEVSALRGITIESVACGAIHTCFVSDDGRVFICGFTDNSFHTRPVHVPIPEPIKQVACGQSHNLALSTTGNVWAWGSSDYGQVGHGQVSPVPVPRLVLQGGIAQVAAGRYHSFALTDTGVLYSWGCGENGQLGLGTDPHNPKNQNVMLPTIVVPILGTVVGLVSCGQHHTAVITSAPWSKLSSDLKEWLSIASMEHEFKEKEVSSAGIDKKAHARISKNMREYMEGHTIRKRREQEKDQSEQEKDLGMVFDVSAMTRKLLDGQSSSTAFPDLAGREAESKEEDGEHKVPHDENIISEEKRAVVDGVELPELGDLRLLMGEEGGEPSESMRDGSGARTVAPPGAASAGIGATDDQDGHSTLTLPDISGTEFKSADTWRSQSARSAAKRREKSRSGADTARAGGDVSSTRRDYLKKTSSTISRMTTIVHKRGEVHTQRFLQMEMARVYAKRKMYDRLKHATTAKERVVSELEKELTLLTQNSAAANAQKDRNTARLNGLKMQLNTVNIKIDETRENRKNYESNIGHLKDEDMEHFKILKELRKQNSETSSLYAKLDKLREQIAKDKDKSVREQQQFKKDIEEYRSFMKRQLDQFASILRTIRAENEKRMSVRSQRNERQKSRRLQRLEQLEQELREKIRDADVLSKRLISLNLKLHHFQDSYKKISAATGVQGMENANEIINKFFNKTKVEHDLKVEIGKKEQHVKELTERQAALRRRLQEVKEAHRVDTWRDVEQLQETCRTAQSQLERAEAAYNTSRSQATLVREGVLQLSNRLNLPPSELDQWEAAKVWSAGDCNAIFDRIHQELATLLEFEEQVSKRLTAERERQKLQESINLMMGRTGGAGDGGGGGAMPFGVGGAGGGAGGGGGVGPDLTVGVNTDPVRLPQDDLGAGDNFSETNPLGNNEELRVLNMVEEEAA